MGAHIVNSAPVDIYLEQGSRKVFACALDWPGWCRSGRGDEAAIEALAASAARYGEVAAEAGISLPPGWGSDFHVVERIPGSGTTDFGAPDKVAAGDHDPLDPAAAGRLADLVAAAWVVFGRVVAGAPPDLRKGPRGGGRDRDQIVAHVEESEVNYARTLGIKGRQPEVRRQIVEVLRASDGSRPVPGKGWPPRYAARRIAWHALYHAWEVEDKSEPA